MVHHSALGHLTNYYKKKRAYESSNKGCFFLNVLLDYLTRQINFLDLLTLRGQIKIDPSQTQLNPTILMSTC